MMNTYYSILFDLIFQHNYFVDPVTSCFGISPSVDTQTWMKNQAIVFKETTGGFRLVYESDKKENVERKNELLSSNAILRFVLTLKDPLFYNYTDLTITDLSSVLFHFHNLSGNSDRHASKANLYNGDAVSTADTIDLVSFGTDFFVKPFGVIDIQLDQVNSGELYIRFREKATYWRYLLVSEHLRELNAPAISDGHMIFKGPAKVVLPNRTEVLAFESVEPLVLAQRSKHEFQLLENFDQETKKGRTILRRLPTPDINLISALPKGEPEATYSEIIL